MKKALMFLMGILILASCTNQDQLNEPFDKWNGYSKYLKGGDTYHDLIAARHDIVGEVTYGLTDTINPDSGYFYVIYQCFGDYKLSETHMYAGEKLLMPMNKIKKNVGGETSSPKIGLFPYGEEYDTPVQADTFYINCMLLPDVDTGFVVASHCVVIGPSGYNETGWAEGDSKFTDKDWGWYDTYSYEVQNNKFTILYATAYANDTLKLYHMDMTNGTVEMILKEFIGDNADHYDGAAYYEPARIFFFANYSTGQLYTNNLDDENSISVSAGFLSGIPSSATFYTDTYYYVDENDKTINGVNFTTDWQISGESILDTIPSDISTVYDIAMDLDGTTIYMLGELADGSGRQLLTWDLATETFYSTSITIPSGTQIAYGSDGTLYAVAPVTEGGTNAATYMIDTSTGNYIVIEDDIIIIDDPFSDMTIGAIE